MMACLHDGFSQVVVANKSYSKIEVKHVLLQVCATTMVAGRDVSGSYKDSLGLEGFGSYELI